MQINIQSNPFQFSLEDLVLVGKRQNNPKRNFLFISQVLGKHLEVIPDVCKTAGYLLSSLAYPNPNQNKYVDYLKNQDFDIKPYFQPIDFNKKVLVIGFAETATGLGMSVASSLQDSTFYTTTRENIELENLLTFEEEHSHATTHKLYSLNSIQFSDFDELILVDDEITTGNSMLNLIREIYKKYHVKNYRVLTILDWRSKENCQKFDEIKKELGISVSVHAVISGTISSDDNTVYNGDAESKIVKVTNHRKWGLPKFTRTFLKSDAVFTGFIKDTGRFGVDFEAFEYIETISKEIAKKINDKIGSDKKILVVSHGENIYIPSRIASYIDGDVKFKTTTRSPIFVDGEIIKSRSFFMDKDVKYYFYNAETAANDYDYVLFLNESNLNVMLTDNMILLKL